MILPRRSRRLIDRLAAGQDAVQALLFEDAAIGMLVLDHAQTVLRSNMRLRALAATDPDGAAAATLFVPADQAAIRDAFASGLRGDRLASPLRFRLAGEAATTVAVTFTAVREADGAISGLLVRLMDIEAQRQLEARLVHGEKLQAVGQLAGGIAHDFNNLLTAVMGALDSALDRSGVDAETVADLRQARTGAERGAALVRQLLAFGRRQTLQPRVVAVNGAVAELAGLLRHLLGEKIRLVVALEPPGRHVHVDPTQFDQVLVNLAVNARDAMPQGGVLTLRTTHRALYRTEIHGAEIIPAGRYVVIAVEDTGIGIPPEILPRIFEPFFTTRRGSGGSGLGLSTVLGIVRQSEGFLTVDSVPGQGTAMRVYLPRFDGEVTEAMQVQPPAAVAPMVPGRILLVEDDEAVRHLAQRALRRAGWQVVTADSAESALASAAAWQDGLDLLISDVVMPGMEGPALAVEVRKICPGLPVILVSGYAESALRGDLAGDGVAFLSKPYSLAELLAAAAAVRK